MSSSPDKPSGRPPFASGPLSARTRFVLTHLVDDLRDLGHDDLVYYYRQAFDQARTPDQLLELVDELTGLGVRRVEPFTAHVPRAPRHMEEWKDRLKRLQPIPSVAGPALSAAEVRARVGRLTDAMVAGIDPREFLLALPEAYDFRARVAAVLNLSDLLAPPIPAPSESGTMAPVIQLFPDAATAATPTNGTTEGAQRPAGLQAPERAVPVTVCGDERPTAGHAS